MAKGYYLVKGDITTCGGKILEGDPTDTVMGIPVAREQENVTCGKHAGTYKIVGHIPNNNANGRKYAGSLHSTSSCPCGSKFIPSRHERTYGGKGHHQPSLYFLTLC